MQGEKAREEEEEEKKSRFIAVSFFLFLTDAYETCRDRDIYIYLRYEKRFIG